MYDFNLRLLMNEQNRAIGFRVLLKEEEIAQLYFFEGFLVPNCCMLHHHEDEIYCKDRIEALHILTERLNAE